MSIFGVGRGEPLPHISQMGEKEKAEGERAVPFSSAAAHMGATRVTHLPSRALPADLSQACQALDMESNIMQANLSRAEMSLAHLDAVIKRSELLGAVHGPALNTIGIVREHVYNPLDLLAVGFDIHDFVKRFGQITLNTEFFFQALQGLGTGTGLIYRKICIQNAEQVKTLLESGLKDEYLTDSQRRILTENIKALAARIVIEKERLKNDAKGLGITTMIYAHRGIRTIWKLSGELKPVAGASLGWVCALGIAVGGYFDYKEAEGAEALHSGWLKKWKSEHGDRSMAAIAEKLKARRQAYMREPPSRSVKITKLKWRLSQITHVKQSAISDLLGFRKDSKEWEYLGTAALAIMLAVLETIAVVASIGALAMFPSLGIVVLGFLFLGAGIHYWHTNRPNLFSELFKSSLHSTYYGIRHSIDNWLLQNKKIKLLEHQAALLDIVAKQRFGQKLSSVDQLQVEKLGKEQRDLQLKIRELDTQAQYWKNKLMEIRERLLNAELRDLNDRLTKGRKPLNLRVLIGNIAESLPSLTEEDKKELKHTLNLDLSNIPANVRNLYPIIRERIVSSFIGMNAEETTAFLQQQKVLGERVAEGSL